MRSVASGQAGLGSTPRMQHCSKAREKERCQLSGRTGRHRHWAGRGGEKELVFIKILGANVEVKGCRACVCGLLSSQSGARWGVSTLRLSSSKSVKREQERQMTDRVCGE